MIEEKNKTRVEGICDGIVTPGACHITAVASIFSSLGSELAVEVAAAGATEAIAEGVTTAVVEGVGEVSLDLFTEQLPDVLVGDVVDDVGGSLFETAFENVTAGDLITGGVVGVAGLSQIRAASLSQAALEAQAELQEFNATNELLKGQKTVIEQTEQLNRDLEEGLVQTLAAGIRNEGSPAAAQRATIRKGLYEIDTARRTSQILARSRELSGSNLRTQGEAELASGIAQGGLISLEGGRRQLRRG